MYLEALPSTRNNKKKKRKKKEREFKNKFVCHETHTQCKNLLLQINSCVVNTHNERDALVYIISSPQFARSQHALDTGDDEPDDDDDDGGGDPTSEQHYYHVCLVVVGTDADGAAGVLLRSRPHR